MPWLNHLKIRTKLPGMAGATLALTVTVGLFALWRMADVNAQSTALAQRWLPSIESVAQIDAASRQFQSLQRRHVAVTSAADMAELDKRLDSTRDELKTANDAYAQKYLSTSDERAILEQWNAVWERCYAVWPAARDLSQSGKPALAAAALVALALACVLGVAMAQGDLSVRVTPKTPMIHNTDRDELGDISRGVDGIITDMTATIAAFTRTQAAIRSVIGETQTLVDAAKRGDLAPRAGRDLTGCMTGTYQGDYAEMQRPINQAIENLEGTLTQVAMASDQVSSAGTQITAGGQSLASGSSQ